MRSSCLLFSLIFLLSYGASAQLPFNAINVIDINNISASLAVHGDFFWEPATGMSMVNFPKNASTTPTSVSALWMSGTATGNKLHLSAQTYRQKGNDYWPGPLDNTGSLNISESEKWARIWKVSFFDINAHINNGTHTATNTPKDILEWPAKGNPNAKGNNNASLSIATDMAPFVDVDNDGKYDALKGDYPDIKGDQMMWWVFSDNGPVHNNTDGQPLMVEVHACAYAYNRGGEIDNAVFLQFQLMNKSGNDYSDFRVATFADIDLGYFRDDYVGFDSTRRMGYGYNGEQVDGTGQAYAYGKSTPIVGYVVLEQPGDNATKTNPLGSFIYYNNDGSAHGNPVTDVEFNYYMRAKFKSGARLQNDFGKKGIPAYGQGTGPYSNYVYTGDPSDTTKWSECVCGNVSDDRRFVLTSGDNSFTKGSSVTFSFALVVTDLDTNNGCPNTDLTELKKLADTAIKYYQTPPKSSVSVGEIAAVEQLDIYPNPVKDKLYITSPQTSKESRLVIYNAIGKKVLQGYEQVGNKMVVNTSSLANGVYFALYVADGVQYTARFVKE